MEEKRQELYRQLLSQQSVSAPSSSYIAGTGVQQASNTQPSADSVSQFLEGLAAQPAGVMGSQALGPSAVQFLEKLATQAGLTGTSVSAAKFLEQLMSGNVPPSSGVSVSAPTTAFGLPLVTSHDTSVSNATTLQDALGTNAVIATRQDPVNIDTKALGKETVHIAATSVSSEGPVGVACTDGVPAGTRSSKPLSPHPDSGVATRENSPGDSKAGREEDDAGAPVQF